MVKIRLHQSYLQRDRIQSCCTLMHAKQFRRGHYLLDELQIRRKPLAYFLLVTQIGSIRNERPGTVLYFMVFTISVINWAPNE